MAVPSCLRASAIVIAGVVIFFAFSGLAVVLLIIGLVSFSPPVLWAALVSLLLAVAIPFAVWLAAQPGLRRQRAVEAEQWARISEQYEAERVRRAAYHDQVRQERLRALQEDRAARAAAAAAGGYYDEPSGEPAHLDGHGTPVYYEILGLEPGASSDDVEHAYRREMRLHHPDRGGESRRAQLINEAYETLREPDKRRAYDRENGLR